MIGKNLAILGDPQIHAGRIHAHRIAAHLAIGRLGDEHADLGLAKQLFQVDPQREIEITGFRPDRLARRVSCTHLREPQGVLQRLIDHHLAQPIQQPIHPIHGLAVQNVRPRPPRNPLDSSFQVQRLI